MGTSINQVLGNLRGFEELQESEVGQKIAQPEGTISSFNLAQESQFRRNYPTALGFLFSQNP